MSRFERSFGLASGKAPGLKCTLEGLSLGGADLLRKTSGGFVPRPLHEIDALLKAAYGDWTSSPSLAAGLQLVARALNDGDLGRAMVAAVHLRLSGVGEGGAERIAKVDVALAKFDPNEPRDERGRWTTGGNPGRGESQPEDRSSPSATGRPPLIPVSNKVYPNVTAFRDKHLADAMKLAAVIGHGATADEVLTVSAKETLYGVDPKATDHGNYFGIHSDGTDPLKYLPGQVGIIQTKDKPMAAFAPKEAFYVSGLIFAHRIRNLADGKDLSDPATFFSLAHAHGWGTQTANYVPEAMNTYGLFRNSARATERRS
jgi:hypothetical protein